LLIGKWCIKLCHMHDITNLACNELMMKIMQSCSFIGSYILLCVENTFNTWTNVLTNEIRTYKWTNVTQISHPFNNLCFKCFQGILLMCEMYKYWMNKFCMISITKLWDAKFVMEFKIQRMKLILQPLTT
jgi:hypothetical protein